MQQYHSESVNIPNVQMLTTVKKLHNQLNSITNFLSPLLPIVNCHMVEFFTEKHWDKLLPHSLKDTLIKMEFEEAVDQFWSVASGRVGYDNSELTQWIVNAKTHCVKVNNDYCLSMAQLGHCIESWGGQIPPEIKVKEFMSSKKSYEVQTMSRLVASLHRFTKATCCIEAGGGRGYLPVALCLGYNIPSLTVDCDEKTLNSAMERIKIIQKQWHTIAKRIKDGQEENISKAIDKDLHRFAKAFITKDTDFSAIVQKNFPQYANEDVKILLTGLHTCGNLGPDSLRIFVRQTSTAAVFNVPCCYHLLTEDVDVDMVDIFQRNFGDDVAKCQGFPMSQHMKGYNLGRNARMLAAQSIDRVVNQRQLPPKSLLYRAVLQIIIEKHLPNTKITEGKLKRVTPKCTNFEEYFKMADSILQLNLFDTLSVSYLTDTKVNMAVEWKKLVLFYLLRLCLAQVVESVILLDRLLFLYENGFEKVYLVKLFDPVLSPRCHSIVAVR